MTDQKSSHGLELSLAAIWTLKMQLLYTLLMTDWTLSVVPSHAQYSPLAQSTVPSRLHDNDLSYIIYIYVYIPENAYSSFNCKLSE